MAPIPHRHLIECKTIDGTSISGWLYTVDWPAPAIIMSHGFNCVKEMTLPDVAESFQSLGFNVLLYDGRSVGASGGQPRNLPDPLQMAEDLSDIYTYVSSLPSVNANQIVLWGMSFGAVISATSAAIDRRAKAIVMVCPLFTYVMPERSDKAYRQLIKDRVSQLRGNDPYYLAPFTPRGENPIGFGGAGGPGGVAAYGLMKAAADRGHPNFRDRIAFQTYQKLAMFRPMEYMDMIKAPVLMIIPELDDISPPEQQRAALTRIKAHKEEHMARGKNHLDIVTGDGSHEVIAVAVRFINAALAEVAHN
ncbi:DltD domain-containing protein [Xylaria arbuscula]|nr:DltD domain-containing protein [Xylaria arbuscula]